MDDLIRAFAQTIDSYTELHYKAWGSTPDECKKLLTMEFPLVQGHTMQDAIKKIGQIGHDKKVAAQQLVEYLAANISTPK